MQSVNLLFPHQLFEHSPLAGNGLPVYLVEEFLFFKQYAFHKQKLAFHRASMMRYADWLRKKGVTVHYVDSQQPTSDARRLIADLHAQGVGTIHYVDVTDNWLERRLVQTATRLGITCKQYPSPLFLNSREDLGTFFKPGKKRFFQTEFYIQQRKKRGILVNSDEGPVGGKWSFDEDNRKKYPKGLAPPAVDYPADDAFQAEARQYVNQHFAHNPGSLGSHPLYPSSFEGSREWLQQFLAHRFADFGAYEDAIVAENSILHHSVLTPMLNTGLLTAQHVVDASLAFAAANDIPLNSTEGFIRQVTGWREFIRGVYEAKGTEQRTRNYWQFGRKIPASFYDGTTGIGPVDSTIRQVLATGYCHHIERLMVLGNFMLLCEFDPDEVYRWFMELFIDAYDWVMVPNIYGMSQFADGGLMSTKPYISGSNYLMKMSNYQKGPWQDVWDALFWRFMHVHRSFFTQNPRLGMLVKTFDKMPEEKQKKLMDTAEAYLQKL